MRAPLSIILPTLNAEAELGYTLGALGVGLEAGVIREVVISDGGSRDATRAIAQSAGAIWVEGLPGRGGHLARGAAQAGGPWFLFLHPDTQLSANWPEVVLAHMRDHPEKAGFFQLQFRADGLMPRLVAGWLNLRARRFGAPCGAQALLIPRQLYTDVGGFPDVPVAEDAAITRALKGRLCTLKATAFGSASGYQKKGWLRAMR